MCTQRFNSTSTRCVNASGVQAIASLPIRSTVCRTSGISHEVKNGLHRCGITRAKGDVEGAQRICPQGVPVFRTTAQGFKITLGYLKVRPYTVEYPDERLPENVEDLAPIHHSALTKAGRVLLLLVEIGIER